MPFDRVLIVDKLLPLNLLPIYLDLWKCTNEYEQGLHKFQPTSMCRVPVTPECDQQLRTVLSRCGGSDMKENGAVFCIRVSSLVWYICSQLLVHLEEFAIGASPICCDAKHLDITQLKQFNSFPNNRIQQVSGYPTGCKMGIGKLQFKQNSSDLECDLLSVNLARHLV